MKRTGKIWFFLVAIFIFALAYTAFAGVSTFYGDTETVYVKGMDDIRFGIDIRGGVDVTFMPADGVDATDEQMDSAESVIKTRLVSLNITDYEVYLDYNKDRIIVRFPWKTDETDFNPESAIAELGATAVLTFREGQEVDENGLPSGVTAETIILEGDDIESATPAVQQDDFGNSNYVVQLKMTEEGTEKFAEATTRLAGTGSISIWMDDTMISSPSVNDAIVDGEAIISWDSSYGTTVTAEEVTTLANQINSGSLPFKLSAESFSTISPTLGSNSLQAMLIAAIIAFLLVCAYIIFWYKLPGAVAAIALLGQTAATIALISGYFAVYNSFTLTLPGIAGIILAIGMGVDANIITAERIKEELRSGKSLDGAITSGFQRGLAPIIDGNVTVIIVSIILMGAFGPTNGIFAKLLTPIFFAFGPSTAGVIYSFGYTLLIGVLLNFVMGVVASRIMLRSVSKMNMFRNRRLYGGKNK